LPALQAKSALYAKWVSGAIICPEKMGLPMSNQHTHVIKKYPNRRLYDTWASRYITLMDVSAMIRDGDTILVLENQNDQDITRSILAQIIAEQEQSDLPLFTTEMLMQFIYLQQEPTQKMFADFFEKNLDWFLQTQQVIHEQVNATDSNPALADKAEVEASKQALWQDIEARFFKSLKSSLPEKDDL